MGEALLRAALSKQVFNAQHTYVLDPNTEKCHALSEELGIQVGNPRNCDTVLLAVKPQHLLSVFPLSTAKNPLLLSVLAGTNTTTLQEVSQTKRICRIMPNTPALVGAGIAALFFSPEITEEEKMFCRSLFSATGGSIELEHEEEMHAVTALSGSGPAYFFRFVELLTESGVSLGLSREISEKLAQKTFTGSAKLFETTNESPTTLRKKVTSPGGTTEAALNTFDKEHWGDVVQKALISAAERSKELGRQSFEK